MIAASLLFALPVATQSVPQDAPPPRTQAVPEKAEEIVVTARRREESVQRVPLAISVLDGAQLDRTGSYNVSRLVQLAPSLTFYSTNPRNSAANIRGLGAPFGLTNDGIEQGVGIYVDGVYYSRIAASTFDFLDVARLEILRGPQGTLYGKNTTAGAISITTRQPEFAFGGRIEASLGNLDFVQVKGSVTGPLVPDVLAARVAVSATSRRGTIFNVATGNWVNEQQNAGVRGQLLWRASDNLDLLLAADYNRQDPECCAQIYVRTGATQRPLARQFAGLAAAFGYAPPSTDPFDRVTDLDGDLRATQTMGGVSLKADLGLGGGTLTSISAFRWWDWQPSNDRDFIGLPITTVSANPSQQRQFTQELRYASSGDNRLDYVIGLFGFHQTIDTQGAQEQGPAASRWLLNPASCTTNPLCAANNPAVLNGLRSENRIAFTNTSAALFGKLTWHLTDRLSFQPGARINYDRKTGDYAATVTTGAGAVATCADSSVLTGDQRGVLAPQCYTAGFSDWNLSYDATLAYDFADDVHGYATYARSFKSGGINLSGLPLDAANMPIASADSVRPEAVDHFEIGLKSQFADRHVTLNLAGFWTEIGDYQATVTNGQLGVLRGYLANAGRVRVRGVEIDATARPAAGLSLNVSGAYTDHQYVRFADAPCPPELAGGPSAGAGVPAAPGTPGGASPDNCDISGQWLPGISNWSTSYGANYEHPATILGAAGSVIAGIDGSYRSRFSSNPSRSAYTDIDGYALVNLRLGFRTESGWALTGWLRNAFDAGYFEVLATQSGNTGLVVGQPGDPRTWGATISSEF